MTLPMRIATVVSLSTLFLAPVVFGQSTQSGPSSQSNPTPSQADFDACNKEAAAKAGNPSASPRPRTGPMMTGSGTPETGSQSGPAPGPSASSSTTTGTTTPGAAGERSQSVGGAQPVRPATEGSQTTSSGTAAGGKDMRITGSDVPGAREAGLTGMGTAGQSDVAYQQAYRDCMKSRGF